LATAPLTAERGLGDAKSDRAFFGHPRGLSTLFFSEMWERFSYYGMRGFLLLYMTAAASAGGMGLDAATAAPIYGMYTSLVYLSNLPGGWVADRLLGPRRAVLVGGILIASGHFSLAVPSTGMFYLGLLLIVMGTGLLKPNISVIVGQLYARKDVRRDAAYSIFYMGINLGAWIGPLITGFLAQDERFRALLAGWGLDPNSAWHWGFAAAGVGMTLGLIQYVLGYKALGTAGIATASTGSPERDAELKSKGWRTLGIAVAVLVLFGVGLASGFLPITIADIVGSYGYLLLAITIGFFAWLFLASQWTEAERKRLYLIVVFFVAAALFWSVFEQAGSTLNLFADRSTHNVVPVYGEFPSSWWQSLNAMFIFALAPVFAWLWVHLGNREPSTPTKFSLGLLGVGLGFLILVPGAQLAMTGVKVGIGWLFMVYLIHTLGELCLSPVGLSSMTKLAPDRIVSQVMGIWFLGASVGNYLGGQAASFYERMSLPTLLTAVAVLPMIAGVAMFIFRKPLTRLGGDRL
jgi:POT family proton-dependent oligopeptide transporter